MRPIHSHLAILGLVLGGCIGTDDAFSEVEPPAAAFEQSDGAISAGLTAAAGAGVNVPVRLVARVRLESTHSIEGTELSTWEAQWIHRLEGRVSERGRWIASSDRVEDAVGSGTSHCYYASRLPDFTIHWEGPLTFPGVYHPLMHLTADGDDILVLYAAPFESTYTHPGAPPCGPGGEIPSGEPWTAVFYMDLLDGERSPHAASSSVAAEQEGVVVTRIPAASLAAGTSVREAVAFSGEDEEMLAHLTVELELESAPARADP